MLRFMRILCGITAGCLLLVACGGDTSGTASISPSAGTTRDPGNVNCPDGKTGQAGLGNFGAYIGTWQATHRQDPQATSDYTIGSVPGHIVGRCSTDDYVVVEEIFLDAPTQATQAIQMALSELPTYANQVYDRSHSGCRVLQYQSQRLAQQLGPDDTNGRVDVTLECDGSTYEASAVTHIFIDLLDTLGDDSQGC